MNVSFDFASRKSYDKILSRNDHATIITLDQSKDFGSLMSTYKISNKNTSLHLPLKSSFVQQPIYSSRYGKESYTTKNYDSPISISPSGNIPISFEP